MTTRNWTIQYGQSVSEFGSYDSGNTLDAHAVVGRALVGSPAVDSGVTMRQLLQFTLDFTGIASITSANLYMRATTEVHTAFGSSPTIRAQRVTQAWAPPTTGGSGEGNWTAASFPRGLTTPTTTTTGQSVPTNVTKTHMALAGVNITSIAQAWLAGSPNYGLVVRADVESGTGDSWEFWTSRGQPTKVNWPYIVVTYVPAVANQPPSVVHASPVTGDVADVSFAPGTAPLTPRPTVRWNYTDPEGTAQSAYQVVVYNDNAGSPGTTLYDSGKVVGADSSLVIPADFIEGNYYHWQAQAWDATDVASGYNAPERFRVRWGLSSHNFDLGGIPSSWSVTGLFSTGQVSIEYNSADDAADTNLGTWMSDIATVTKRRFFRYRAWLLGGSSPGVLGGVVISYSNQVGGLDYWTLPSGGQADIATLVYGSQSLRIDGAGTDRRAWQQVNVLPYTSYWLSGRMKSTGATTAFLSISDQQSTGGLATVTATVDDWAEYQVQWLSGANTQVYIQCGAVGSVGSSAWFDALKLEASSRPSAWTPGFVGNAAAIDAMGVQVDATNGGVMRIKTANGTTVMMGNAGATVTGAKAGNAALASLISQLSTLGIITDGSS